MKIGLLTTSFPRHDGDPAGSFVLGFARTLAARGHRLEVLAPEPANGRTAPRWPGVEVRWVPYARPRRLERTFYGAGVPDNVIRDPAAWPGLLTFPAALRIAAGHRSHRWDALVSHWALPCGWIGSWLARGRPHLAVMHSADVRLLERLPFGDRPARRIARDASALQLVSRDLRDRFLGLLPANERDAVRARCHVAPMGVEAPFPPPERGRARARWGMHGPTALMLGRLVPLKGAEEAVRAMADPSVRMELHVVGDGPDRARLERLARELDAPVRFHGQVTGNAKWELLHGADVLVAPSRLHGRTEGTPVGVLEALHAGLPVVATASGGLGEVVLDGVNGLRVPPRDPSALARALARLQGDPGLRRRLGRAAHREGAQHAWERQAGRLEAMLSCEPGASRGADRNRTASRARPG